MAIDPPTKSTPLIAFAFAFAFCAAATTMHAWQVRGTKAEVTPVAVNDIWSIFQELHNRAHLEH